jgi:hypothetical protein
VKQLGITHVNLWSPKKANSIKFLYFFVAITFRNQSPDVVVSYQSIMEGSRQPSSTTVFLHWATATFQNCRRNSSPFYKNNKTASIEACGSAEEWREQ